MYLKHASKKMGICFSVLKKLSFGFWLAVILKIIFNVLLKTPL